MQWRSGGAAHVQHRAVKPDIVNLLNTEVVKFMNAPDTKALLAKVELDAKTGTPAEFAAFVREETERWAKVIKAANIRGGLIPSAGARLLAYKRAVDFAVAIRPWRVSGVTGFTTWASKPASRESRLPSSLP